jgi:hypothetical protein
VYSGFVLLWPYEGKIFKLIDRLPIKDEFVPAYTKQKRFETSVENIPKRFGVGTGFLKTLTRFLAKSEVGKYPKEYKPRIHGPYYPSLPSYGLIISPMSKIPQG